MYIYFENVCVCVAPKFMHALLRFIKKNFTAVAPTTPSLLRSLFYSNAYLYKAKETRLKAKYIIKFNEKYKLKHMYIHAYKQTYTT